MNGKAIEITVEGEKLTLTPEDVAVERKVLEGTIAMTVEGITVALDTSLDEPLLLEGLAREFVNKINTMRRDMGFAVTDRIDIKIKTTDRVKESFRLHKPYIEHETLATSVTFTDCEGTEWDLNGQPATVFLTKS